MYDLLLIQISVFYLFIGIYIALAIYHFVLILNVQNYKK